ncbi:hypothetical protein [Nocardia sp. NPDC051570]|uniref:hypothetical protein n=1 Tax=Nocardia sp. NPDC051570 TaxID=3364324 RepID=UPI0037A6E870
MNRPAEDAARIASGWMSCAVAADGVIQAYQPPVLVDEQIVDEVLAERARQDARWGQQDHPDGTGTAWENDWCGGLGGQSPGGALGYADLMRACCQAAADAGQVTFRHILLEEVAEAFAETAPLRLRAELLQVAAVAVEWIGAIDRRIQAAGTAVSQPIVTVELPSPTEEV